MRMQRRGWCAGCKVRLAQQSTQTSCRRESAQADRSLPFRRTHARAVNSQISPGRAVHCGLSGGRGRIWLAQPVLDGRSAVCEQRGDESWTLACEKNCSVPWKGAGDEENSFEVQTWIHGYKARDAAEALATPRELRTKSARCCTAMKISMSLDTYKIVLYMACALYQQSLYMSLRSPPAITRAVWFSDAEEGAIVISGMATHCMLEIH